jgi:hypothetical protein
MDAEIVRFGTEVLKHGPDAVKAFGAVVGSVKFTEITKAMLGPAANEVAERIHDEVRLYRFGRQLEMLKKAEKMAKDAGFTPIAVPIKLLFPMLEGASLEENETLHDMWSALLANAASDIGQIVRPGFIALLREMAPDEAQLLHTIFELPRRLKNVGSGYGFQYEANGFVKSNFKQGDTREVSFEAERIGKEYRGQFPHIAGKDAKAEEARYKLCVQSLELAALIEKEKHDGFLSHRLTPRGEAFMAACSPPKPKP